MKRISIIIVTYNSEHDIYDCVASIRQYMDLPKEEVELIIVDNCSREADVMFQRLREQWGDDIVCLHNDKNGGYGQGNNVGLRASTAPVAMIMNPDVRMLHGVLAEAVKRYDEQPGLHVLGMKQYFDVGVKSNTSIVFNWLTNGYIRPFLQIVCNKLDWFFPRRMFVQGSCFFLRKEAFCQVGYFDESNFMYGEEEDIHYRLTRRFGYGCYAYDPHLGYIHHAQGRTPALATEIRIVESQVRLYAKKGIGWEVIVRHMRQNVRLMILRCVVEGNRGARYKVLKELLHYLSNYNGQV